MYSVLTSVEVSIPARSIAVESLERWLCTVEAKRTTKTRELEFLKDQAREAEKRTHRSKTKSEKGSLRMRVEIDVQRQANAPLLHT